MKQLKLLAVLSIFILSSCGGSSEGSSHTSSESHSSSEKSIVSSSESTSKESSQYSESSYSESSSKEEESSSEKHSSVEESSSKQEEFDPTNFASLVNHLKGEIYHSYTVEMDTIYNGNGLKSIYRISPINDNYLVDYYYEKYNKFDLDNLDVLENTKSTYNGNLTFNLNGQVLAQEGDPINIELSAFQINNIYLPNDESNIVEWNQEGREFTLMMLDNLPFEDITMIVAHVVYNDSYYFETVELSLIYSDATTVNISIRVNF